MPGAQSVTLGARRGSVGYPPFGRGGETGVPLFWGSGGNKGSVRGGFVERAPLDESSFDNPSEPVRCDA